MVESFAVVLGVDGVRRRMRVVLSEVGGQVPRERQPIWDFKESFSGECEGGVEGDTGYGACANEVVFAERMVALEETAAQTVQLSVFRCSLKQGANPA